MIRSVSCSGSSLTLHSLCNCNLLNQRSPLTRETSSVFAHRNSILILWRLKSINSNGLSSVVPVNSGQNLTLGSFSSRSLESLLENRLKPPSLPLEMERAAKNATRNLRTNKKTRTPMIGESTALIHGINSTNAGVSYRFSRVSRTTVESEAVRTGTWRVSSLELASSKRILSASKSTTTMLVGKTRKRTLIQTQTRPRERRRRRKNEFLIISMISWSWWFS